MDWTHYALMTLAAMFAWWSWTTTRIAMECHRLSEKLRQLAYEGLQISRESVELAKRIMADARSIADDNASLRYVAELREDDGWDKKLN